MTDRYITYTAVLRVPEHFDVVELDDVPMPVGVEVMFDSSRDYVAGEFGDYGFDLPEDVACVRCGRTPAVGCAGVGNQRLCHGDTNGRTCYETAQSYLYDLSMWEATVKQWAEQRRRGAPLNP